MDILVSLFVETSCPHIHTHPNIYQIRFLLNFGNNFEYLDDTISDVKIVDVVLSDSYLSLPVNVKID